MRTLTAGKIFGVFLLFALAGCGREQAPSPALPTVIAASPANAATGVALNTAVTAGFSSAMAPATINTTTFTLTGPGGAAVAGAVTYSGTTATLTPTNLLAANTVYVATVTTGAQDPSGAALAANFAWSFTTGTIPTVASTNPLNGAINVPINQKITATFSEAMNATTVTAAGTFTVSAAGAGGAAVPGTVTYVAATNTATFAPTANLPPSAQYTATISTAAQNAAGDPLLTNFVWNFTAGKTANTTPPTLTVTLAASGATGVPTNQRISATFSKVMDPATITAAANLAASTQFTATITNTAKDLTGNALVAGAVPNPWSFMTGAGPNTTAPTITLVNPTNTEISVLLNTAVNATFSGAMDAVTITAPGTFTLAAAGAGGAAVSGNVTYDSVSHIATLTPAANLTATTQYTATITNAAKDLSGNALAAGSTANPWSFTTGASVGAAAPNLATASSFGAFGGGAGITNQGINTVINGDIGTTGAS